MHVTFGESEFDARMVNEEDGEVWYKVVRCYRVSFTTAYGVEWNHLHSFPFTPSGERAAQRLAMRVQAALDAAGIKGKTAKDESRLCEFLTEGCWSNRTTYGSRAYVDEEPYIVERERSDARMGLD